MAVDKAKLRKTITAILEDADLDTVSAKKVRQQVEAQLKVDLTDRKKEVDDLVMEIVEEKQEANKSEDESDEGEKKSAKAKRGRAAKNDDSDGASDDEYEPEGKKSKGKRGSDSDEDFGKGKKKKTAAKAKGAGAKKGGTGYTKVCTLSPELSLVMGEPAMARHEVVKKMWSIIKENNLYDPKNKQFAICDDKLLAVFGVKRFRTFGMMKYLKNHFVD